MKSHLSHFSTRYNAINTSIHNGLDLLHYNKKNLGYKYKSSELGRHAVSFWLELSTDLDSSGEPKRVTAFN